MTDALLLDCEQTEGGVNILMKRPDLGSRLDVALLYDLERVELTRYSGLLIGLHADQRYLAVRRDQILDYLRAGGTVVFCGHVAYSFLPDLEPYRPIPNYKVADLEVCRSEDHPVWRGVDVNDLTWRRGVAGFYGRGFNPPPAGARIIHTLGPQAYPVDFEYASEGKGRILVHAGADLWGYLDGSSTAARIGPQLLDWVSGTREGSRA
jgi:hypothetical protein